MLACLFASLLAALVPQGPVAPASAVVVRGDAELSPALAYASAKAKVDSHIRELWRERAERELAAQRPFWLPEVLTTATVRRWLADLPIDQLVATVDREDRQRDHEFGSSYQTTLWVAEDGRAAQRSEQRLRGELRRLERTTVVKCGGIAAFWTLLALGLGWIDRLSRGYMTGRLRWIGVAIGTAVPAVAFLV